MSAQIIAADPRFSVWVSANAGSGKTYVLVNRILRLLLAGTAPNKILCLTFTRAAAAEMSDRLSRMLGAWAIEDQATLEKTLRDLTWSEIGPEDIRRARRLFAEVMEAPGGIKIQTIHSFCQSILQRFPVEAGIAPHVQIMDDHTSIELLREARRQILTELATEAAEDLRRSLQTVIAFEREGEFAQIVTSLCARWGDIVALRTRYGSDKGILQVLGQKLGIDPEIGLDPLITTFIEGIEEARAKEAAAALLASGVRDQERGDRLARFLELPPDQRRRNIATYLSVFLKKNTQEILSSLAAKSVQSAAPKAYAFLMAEAERAFHFSEQRAAAETLLRTDAMLTLGGAIMARFARLKNDTARIDYQDCILLVRKLLESSGAGWVLYKLDGGIDHVLIDEAQDTSPDQWEIIRRLTADFFSGDGARSVLRTVFAVGDEKQSIFSFQGAAPDAFAAMEAYFAEKVTASALDWRPVDLDRSFRSTPAVLQAVDAVFAQPMANAGVTSGDKAIMHYPDRDGAAGLVELWSLTESDKAPVLPSWAAPVDQPADGNARQKLADRIAATIKTWLDTGEILASEARPIAAGDIMILVRSRNAFFEYMIRALKRRQIPVAGADRMVLTEQLAVMDLMTLGAFLLQPSDDLALATLLKSPFFGLTDDDLLRLAPGRRDTLWQALQDDDRYMSVVMELTALRRRIDFVSPYEFFAQFLGAGDGRRRLVARLGLEANDPIDMFLDHALRHEQGHAPSMQGFLAWLSSLDTEIRRDMESRGDMVRVMTVHGAKGLDGNIVFIPDTTEPPKGMGSSRLRWEPNADPPLVIWAAAKDQEDKLSAAWQDIARQRAAEEYRRLLYVAMTRARDRLYICGSALDRAAGQDQRWWSLAAQALQPIAEEILQDDGTRIWRIETGRGSIASRTISAPPAQLPPPSWVFTPPPAEPEPQKPLAPSRPDEPEPAPISPIGDHRDRRFRRGLLIHRLLQSLPELGSEKRKDAGLRYLAGAAADLALADREALLGEALRILDHPDCAVLFGAGSRAEAPIVGQIGRRIVSGQIDRLAVTEDSIFLADFKTNRPPPRHIDDVPLLYLRQMAAYRALLQRIYPHHTIRTLLIWTERAEVMELPDRLLAPDII